MTRAERAEHFLARVKTAHEQLLQRNYAFSGDTARCLWMLARIPGGSLDIWRTVCHPWPEGLAAVGDLAGTDLQPDVSPVAKECGSAMLTTREFVSLPTFGESVPLVKPAFVLAQVLTESDPLRATRVADMLRCVRADQDVDLEEVRSLLKAVRAGDEFETLWQLAHVV